MAEYVVLLRSKDDPTYQKYLRILMACKEAGIDPPPDVDKYFGGNGVDCDPEYPLEIDFKPTPWTKNEYVGFELNLNELPEGVSRIRFFTDYD